MGLAIKLIDWQKKHGRHNLPWQGTRDPYPIWVSEIMLQQTQVATVIPYFNRFMARFPDIATLAQASEEEVLTHWAGLGYYARGRNLHRAARQVVAQHAGVFPEAICEISALPGIGQSTAAAIAVFAFGTPATILDGNVKRVLTRAFGVAGWPGAKSVEAHLWQLAAHLVPQREVETYTQALMDLGATVCTRTRPQCGGCPLGEVCFALRNAQVDQFPAPRPRKNLPERHAQLLAIQHGADILLEKRPAPGIWGGLWCLPEIGMQADADNMCLSLTGLVPARIDPLPRFTHTFTHFRLHIQPQAIKLSHFPHQLRQSGAIWMPVADAVNAAVPKPVKRILQLLLGE